jgi:hypothetical protein
MVASALKCTGASECRTKVWPSTYVVLQDKGLATRHNRTTELFLGFSIYFWYSTLELPELCIIGVATRKTNSQPWIAGSKVAAS